MTISDFCATERQRVINFYEWYTLMHRSQPDQYPLTLEPGEWDEQYRAWEG